MEIVYKESKYNLDYFLKELWNGKKVLDFHKIASLHFPIHLLITQRGALGKGTNIKMYLKDRWEKDDSTALWLRNLSKDLDNEKTKFLKDMHKKHISDRERWLECKWSGDRKKNNLWLSDAKGKFLKLQSVNAGEDEKGSREIYGDTVWDEFNVNQEKVSDMLNKYDSLIHSGEDLVANYKEKDETRMWFFGNYKSMNHPVINAMGISMIPFEITEVYLIDEDGEEFPLMLMIVPQLDENQRKEVEVANKKNWRFRISQVMGTDKHSYFNENLYDELHFIKQYVSSSGGVSEDLKPYASIYHKKQYMNVYRVMRGVDIGKFHVIECNKDNIFYTENGTPILYTMQSGDIIEQSYFKSDLKNGFREFLTKSNITFENTISRLLFITSIK